MMSSVVRAKSKMARFSAIRSRRTDFGMATTSRVEEPRSTTCRDGLAVSVGDGRECRVGEEVVLAFREAAPAPVEIDTHHCQDAPLTSVLPDVGSRSLHGPPGKSVRNMESNNCFISTVSSCWLVKTGAHEQFPPHGGRHGGGDCAGRRSLWERVA